MQITDQELLNLAKRGLIPGPNETQENFLNRISKFPFFQGSLDGSVLTTKLFGFSPDWIQVRYTNKGLALWEGGCTLIEESKVELLLRKRFEKKKKFLIYDKEEILAHEYVHAARMAFEEPRFEEILAYQTSNSFLRRYCGPFFKATWLTTTVAAIVFSGYVLSLFFAVPLWIMLIVGSLWKLGLFKMVRDQRIFKKCLNNLSHFLGAKDKVLSIMLRLTDKEIVTFSNYSASELSKHFKDFRDHSLRWKQISLLCDER